MHPSAVVYQMSRTCLALLFCLVTWLSSSSLLLVVSLAVSQAQVRTTLTSDGTLGTTVTPNGNLYKITGGTRPGNGPNLFHSFDRFSIGTNDTARFTGPAGITNILSRVTGGQRSEIDGTLQSTIPGAHLYLLNPSGVVFGPNATLDVQGSFHVSTADYLRLADGARFFARLSEQSTLSVAPPVAFGFLDSHPAGIVIQGSQLWVQEGQTFSVTGGDITITASPEATSQSPTLRAQSGRIYLTSVAAPGDVQVEVVKGASRLMDNRPPRLGSVLVADGAQVDVSGDRGGTVLVEAGALTLTNGATVLNQTSGGLPGGDILVRAHTLTLRTGSGMIAFTAPESAGDAGSVRVEAQTVTIREGSFLSSVTQGAGRSGNVTVTAATLVMDGSLEFSSQISTSSAPGSTGDAGSVRVEARTVSLTNGAQIQSGTAGAGKGGDVTVMARDAVTVDGFGGGFLSLITASNLPDTTGDAGSVRVEAQTVTATHGAQISSVTFGAGQGGSVTVIGRERVTFRGTSPEGEDLQGKLIPGDSTFPSGAFANSHGAGAPGLVQVTAPEVMLAEGGRISSVNIASEKAGGTVIVQAPNTLTISGAGSSLRTRSFGPGRGGDIAVNAGAVSLTVGADISAASIKTGDATGSGDAGNVTVIARKNILLQNGSVTTEADLADGGNIHLMAPQMIRLRDSQITAAVGGGPETVGGNITIDPQFVLLQNSQIVANAFQGQGGNIRIQAQQAFLADPASLVSASSTLGINGQVDIRAPVKIISGVVAPLSQAFAQSAPLLRSPCAARLHEGTVSTLVERGRDGVPATPDGVLPSRLPLAPLDTATPTHDGRLPSAALIGSIGESQRDLSASLSLRGWATSVDALRLLPGDCASR